jgi:hypothetical protein
VVLDTADVTAEEAAQALILYMGKEGFIGRDR